jgi:hypothetical protein
MMAMPMPRMATQPSYAPSPAITCATIREC